MIAVSIVALILAAIPCAMVLRNLGLYVPPRAGIRLDQPQSEISVLIPARNEADQIKACIQSVLVNRHVDVEVIVLDDHSSDDTGRIVLGLANSDHRVRLATTPALPAGWTGKAYACQTLSTLATKPLLVFMSAHVRLSPNALDRMAAFLKDTGADLASGLPRQETRTWAERLLIPLIHFVALGLVPMAHMRRKQEPAWGAGIGQLMIARAGAYRQAGGHAAIREHLHDGLHLARSFRAAGFKTDLFDATDVASCRLHADSVQALLGLSVNAVSGLATPRLIGPVTLLFFGGQVLPWLLLAWNLASPGWPPLIAAAAAILSLLPRLLMARRFKQPWSSAVLHPLGICLLLAVQWYAFVQRLLHRPRQSKGRSYA